MAKQMNELTDILKKEGFADTGCQYYREVEFNGRWRLYDVLENMLLAYSMIKENVELVIVINTDCAKEIENRVTVDRNLSPVGRKFKDIAGRAKMYVVEESEGRNFVTVKLKPNTFSVLKLS
ncbi:MAG TPA: hypothetical protein VLJ60_10510 [bacterium]|nr:hypothetical protein [bacterium]